MKELEKEAAKITSLHIQGATNIALFAVDQMAQYVGRNASLPPKELWDGIIKATKILYNSRSTEPAMKNGLSYLISFAKSAIDSEGYGNVNIAEIIQSKAQEYKDMLKESSREIARIGARRIPKNTPNFRIMTHCHSSVVEGILIEAHKQKKEFEVICTETRPLYQGRITARELYDAGINVTLVVDSAMRWVCKNKRIDMAVIGADAITSEGTVLNKIGSRLLALVAKEDGIPLYVASQLLKYSQETLFGTHEDIDMRGPEEVWSSVHDVKRGPRPEGVHILNPAFESVNRYYISSLISEVGIFPSGQAQIMFAEKYPDIQKGYKILEHENING